MVGPLTGASPVMGQPDTRLVSFSYDAPELTALSPARSPTSGATSTPITMHGFNFGVENPASLASARWTRRW